MVALGSEVVWTRLLSLLLGSTTYTFSLILAVFLTGLGGGSAIGSWVARSARHPRYLFGALQLAAVVALAYTAYVVNVVLPFRPDQCRSSSRHHHRLWPLGSVGIAYRAQHSGN
jgi:spermidine synthase